MSHSLEKLIISLKTKSKQAESRITELAIAKQFTKVKHLAEILEKLNSRTTELERIHKLLERDLIELNSLLNPKEHHKGPQTALRIILRLPGDNPTVLEEAHAANTLQRFIEILCRGDDQDNRLQKISSTISGGGSMVSRDPKLDFVNPKQGTLYSNLPIRGTRWHVKTQTSTEVKVRQIKEIARILEIPMTSLEVETPRKT